MATKRTSNDELIKELISLVFQEMYTGNIKIAALADQLALSPSQLNRRVKDITGKSVSAFVMELRINKVKEMLKMFPCYTITEVAHAAGFSDLSHLTHCFHGHTGMSPTEYIQSGAYKEDHLEDPILHHFIREIEKKRR